MRKHSSERKEGKLEKEGERGGGKRGGEKERGRGREEKKILMLDIVHSLFITNVCGVPLNRERELKEKIILWESCIYKYVYKLVLVLVGYVVVIVFWFEKERKRKNKPTSFSPDTET